jgi:multiple sugar transport system substrate-binding protein
VLWSDAHTKILAATAAGSGPDVITGGMSWRLELGQNGGMIDLNAQYPDIAKDIQSKTMPNIWEAIVPTTGEVYGVQQTVTVNMMDYRTDILEEVTGLKDTPKTWEEFTALLDKLQEAGYDKPMLWRWGNTDWLGYQSILYQAGGTYYSPDCSKVTLDTPKAAQALDFMLDLYNKYNTPTDAWPDQVAFVNGDAPVMIDGNWIVPDFALTRPEIDGKWIPAAMPAGPSGKSVTFLGGNIIGIMSYAPKASQDAAADFIHSISRKPPPLCGVALHSSAGMAGAVGSAGREPWWSVKQTGSRRDKIPEKPPPSVVVRNFEVCHSLVRSTNSQVAR